MRELEYTRSNHSVSPFYMPGLALTFMLGIVAPSLSNWAHGQDDDAASTIAVAKPDAGTPPRPASPASSNQPVGNETNASEASASQASADAVSGGASPSEVSMESDLTILETSSEPERSSSPGEVADGVRELSVEPGTLPMLPADRPAWIGAPADFSQSVHRLYVGSQITDSQQDIDLMLDVPLVAAVGDYIDRRLLGIDGAALDLQQQVDADYIRKNLIDEPQGFVAKLNTGGAPVYQKWVTVSITPAQRQQIEQWYREAVQRKRLAPVGLGLLGIVSFVGISHLVLRRRHGLPKSLPVAHSFASGQPRANPTVGAARRSRGRFPVLMVLGCVLVFPLLIGFSLLFWGLSRKSSKERTRVQEYSVHVGHHMPPMPEIPPMPEMPKMAVPQLPDGAQVVQESDSQVIYRSGGQQIIIRKSHK